MAILLLSITVIAASVILMAAGVLLDGRCLRGSCGGPDVLGPDGEPLSCSNCPLRRAREET